MSHRSRSRSGDVRYALPAILTAALLARVSWVIYFASKPKSDAIWYFRSATEISMGLGYNNPDGIPTAFFPVGYPAFLGALFYFFGSSQLFISICRPW